MQSQTVSSFNNRFYVRVVFLIDHETLIASFSGLAIHQYMYESRTCSRQFREVN